MPRPAATQDPGGPAVARTPFAPGNGPSQPRQTPAAPAAPTQLAAPPQSYTVVSGDSPGAIAEKLNVPSDRRPVWIDELLKLNNTTAGGLQIGQVLKLPPGALSAPPPAPPGLPQPNVTRSPNATPAPGAPVIVQLTSPVAREGEVTLRVRAGASLGCSPTHLLPNGGVSGAAGLGPKLADAGGNVSWVFTIPANTPVGEGSIRVICAGLVVAAPLVVS